MIKMINKTTKKNLFYSEQGITLVELVVAMGIASIIIAVLVTMSMRSNELFYKAEEKSNNQMQMRNAVDGITKDIRYAKDLTMIEDADIPSGPSDSRLPATDPSLDEDEYNKYIYFSDDGVVLLEYIGTEWIAQNYLEDKIDLGIDSDTGKEKSYFILNVDEKNVKFAVTDKSAKHDGERRFELSTTINLLNAKEYPPTGTNAKEYKGIKYN